MYTSTVAATLVPTREGRPLKVDAFGQTSVPGVYAAGDAATAMQQAIIAAANGAVAATGINRKLLGEDFDE